MGVSLATVEALRGIGEDVRHLREEGLTKLEDELILLKAVRESRVVLTFDLDFGELLAASSSRVPSVVLFRLRNQTPRSVTPKLLQVLTEQREALEQGAIILVDDAGYRVRHLPI